MFNIAVWGDDLNLLLSLQFADILDAFLQFEFAADYSCFLISWLMTKMVLYK